MRYLEAAERKQTAGSQLIVSASNVPKFANCMDYGARSTVHGAAKDSLGRLSQGAYCNRRPVSQLAFSILLIRLGRHWSSWQVAYCRTACLLRRISCRGSELPLLAPPSGRAERLISCHHRKYVSPQLLSYFVAFVKAAYVQNPQQRASLPQGLSEEALKEALQVPCIWVESQDLQDIRCQEVEREVSITVAMRNSWQHLTCTTLRYICCRPGSTSVPIHTERSAALRPWSFSG